MLYLVFLEVLYPVETAAVLDLPSETICVRLRRLEHVVQSVQQHLHYLKDGPN